MCTTFGISITVVIDVLISDMKFAVSTKFAGADALGRSTCSADWNLHEITKRSKAPFYPMRWTVVRLDSRGIGAGE